MNLTSLTSSVNLGNSSSINYGNKSIGKIN